nr:hypothetical protein Iba_chr04bCG19780 [Ipomoea batatas]GMC87282.1 hypothetical protein Iba_chr04dCG18680 [Ipomoea batatas]
MTDEAYWLLSSPLYRHWLDRQPRCALAERSETLATRPRARLPHERSEVARQMITMDHPRTQHRGGLPDGSSAHSQGGHQRESSATGLVARTGKEGRSTDRLRGQMRRVEYPEQLAVPSESPRDAADGDGYGLGDACRQGAGSARGEQRRVLKASSGQRLRRASDDWVISHTTRAASADSGAQYADYRTGRRLLPHLNLAHDAGVCHNAVDHVATIPAVDIAYEIQRIDAAGIERVVARTSATPMPAAQTSVIIVARRHLITVQLAVSTAALGLALRSIVVSRAEPVAPALAVAGIGSKADSGTQHERPSNGASSVTAARAGLAEPSSTAG